MTDLTYSTDSICVINNKYNYTGILTIPPDSTAITALLNRLCFMKLKPQLFNRGCEHGRTLVQDWITVLQEITERSNYITVNRLMQN